mmetsp:Transcript_22604/g.52167  ORF Transcript_22604/g.52167 Transcript_22604/m.52167 type:complete len:188 (-) Transcript_22604:749-1312(-)
MTKKYTIKIPKDISVLYSKKNTCITIIGPLCRKSLKLTLYLKINQKTITITNQPIYILPNNKKKNIKSIQGTTASSIKKLIIETSTLLHAKLKLIGVGYKASIFDIQSIQIIQLKLGFSHLTYFKINNQSLKIHTFKSTKLIIFGNCYHSVNHLAAKIRSTKKPEPYKGKGILFNNEKINLKTGKKV